MGMGDEILVVKRDVLFKESDFQGFNPIDEKNYLDIILENYNYLIRTHGLENDSSIKQPIPYVWILNPSEKKIFLYKRSKTGNEGRLRDKFSGGVGGHIDKKTEENSDNPILDAMIRELKEEVFIKEYPIPKIVGFVNDDSDTVGEVHFGIVALAETDHEVKPIEDMTHGKFYSINEIEEIFSSSNNEVESWTRISWPFIKDYLSKL
ncbi:MAG: NUDIX domain-containing protein [Nanoarchaeota archaeon]